MATINAYRMTPGKPMVWSMESARRFLAATKNPLYIRTDRGYFEICGGAVALNERVDDWVEIQRWRKDGDEAVRCIYQLRKIINARFKD